MDEIAPKQIEHLFPTRRKESIGSYLSWPVGAERISVAFANVPQASAIELTFIEHWRKYHQGKWPACYSVIEVEYCRYRDMHRTGEPIWTVCIRPVPRDQRAKIKEALESKGFSKIADWLDRNARLSGREGRLTMEISWNSELGELTSAVRGAAVPEVATDAASRKRKREEATIPKQ